MAVAVEVPPYIDRYVTSEINRVSGQIDDLKEAVTRGFAEVRADMDRRFAELRGETGRRFEETGRRFDRVDQ